MKKKVLVVDDEKTLVKALTFNLEKEGYEVVTAYDGEEALKQVESDNPDLVILDLMLPGLDGFEVCRRVRKNLDIPIIMLTAKGDDIDKILGLELGADDYITKPFNPRELIARVKAILRRTDSQSSSIKNLIKVQDLQIDLYQHKVRVKGNEIDFQGICSSKLTRY